MEASHRLEEHRRVINYLESTGKLDRALEFYRKMRRYRNGKISGEV